MDSYVGEDPTLPGIASDGDSLLDAEISLGTGNLLSLPDGSIPVMPKSSTGRMSPIRAHTMKDFEQQLSDLKKENFNLKLRIYFLEERQERKWDADGEDLIKTNIQLNVEVETLKKDLMDKTELMNQAASTMETLRLKQKSTSRPEDVDRIAELESQLVAATDDAENAKFALADAKSQLQEAQDQIRAESMRRWAEGGRAGGNEDPASSLASPKGGDVKGGRGMEFSPSPDSDKDSGAPIADAHCAAGAFFDEAELHILEKKASLLDLLLPPSSIPASSSSSSTAYLTQLEKDVARVAEELRSAASTKDRLNGCKCGAADGNIPRHTFEDLEELVDGQEVERRKLEATIAELKTESESRQTALDGVEEKLRSKSKAADAAAAAAAATVEKLELDLETEKIAIAKGLKAIQGMSKILHQKEKEIEELQTSLDEAGEGRRHLEGQMAAAAAKSQKDKDQDARDKSDRLLRVQELEETLRDKKLEMERLLKSNERKDKELTNLNSQLDGLEERLRAADSQVQDLRDELQSEKQKANDRADATQQHFQTLLDEAQRESTTKDRLINRLSRSLKDRDDSIGELLEASELGGAGSGNVTPTKQMEIINKLKERLKERDKAVEDALTEKASCLEEKEEDLRKLRRQLRDREREAENSNAVLLATEETIDSLERDVKDRETANKKLAAELKDKDKLLRENSELHSTSTRELEATIERLQAALDAQNRLQSPGADVGDDVIKSLREALLEKDKFIQELLKERAEAARQSDETAQKLVGALTDKDNDIKSLYDKEEREKAELNRRILELTTDLNRKKFELEQAETRGQWSGEQQAETISQLRQALKEKDDVIQSLVESGRGKDVLLCASSPSIRDPDVEEKMREMRVSKEKAEKENRKLKKQLQDKEAGMKSQQAATDRLNKDAAAAKTKANESQKELQTEIQQLKETIETIKRESSTTTDYDRVQKLQDELDALRRALEAAGVRSAADPHKVGIEISHLIRRASLTNGDVDLNGGDKEGGTYSLLREAAAAEREAYAAMTSTLGADGAGEANESMMKLQEELEKIASLRHHLEEAMGTASEKGTPKKMTPSKIKLQTKGGKSPRGSRSGENQRDSKESASAAAIAAAAETAATMSASTSTSTTSLNGDPLTYEDPAKLHHQLRQKERELKRREEENQSLREQLFSKHRDTSPRLSSNSSDDTSNLHDASFSASSVAASAAAADLNQEEAKSKIKKQKKKLKAADRLIDLLKRQIQLNKDTEEASGFDPQLIVELASEIERLKSDLEEAKVKLKASSPSKGPRTSSSQSSSSAFKPPSGKSQIPVRSRGFVERHDDDDDGTRGIGRESVDSQRSPQQRQQPRQLQDLKEMNEKLAGKLAATEATVRRVAKKARRYRTLLAKSGVLNSSPQRSSSESMLDRLCNDDDDDSLPNDSVNGNLVDDAFGNNVEEDRARRDRLSRSRSCASLVNGEEEAPATSTSPFESKWSRSSPSLLSKGEIERLAEEASQSQDLGFLKSSVETLKEQLGRHSDTIGDLRSRLQSADETTSSKKGSGDSIAADPRLDDTTTANLKAFEGLQHEISNLRNQLQSSQSANQSLQRQLLEATLPIDGASDANDSAKPIKPTRNHQQQHFGSAPSVSNNKNGASPLSGRSTTSEDVREREKEILVLKKQIADAHNLCQCLKDSVDDLESLVDTALEAGNSETPTEGSRGATTTKISKAAIGRQFHQAKSTTQNLLKTLQRGGGSFLSLEAVDPEAARSKAAEIISLEEANEDLREEVDRLTTELQSATSLHTAWEQQMAALEAEAAELHAEVGALRNLLNEKNAQNAKYRGILSENQSAAASARDELERLAEEVEGKDLLISQLHQKLKKATARLQQAQTAGNTIYSTTEDEDESGALKATPRAGRHGAHPPRPHRKFHRHRTPSSASEGDVSLQQQQQLSGKWSGSRGEVTGRSLDEDEADDSADGVAVDGALPAVGVGFPMQSPTAAAEDDSYAFSGPGLINNATPPPLRPKPVSTNTVGTQFDPSVAPLPSTAATSRFHDAAARSSAYSHFPTPEPSSASPEVPPLHSLLPDGGRRRPSSSNVKVPFICETRETQTDLELLIGYVEKISSTNAPSISDVPFSGILKPSSSSSSFHPSKAFDLDASAPDASAASVSRPNSTSRKCLFPEQQQRQQSSLSPPAHSTRRSTAVDGDPLLVDKDGSNTASEADAEDSVRQTFPPRTKASIGIGVSGGGVVVPGSLDQSIIQMESLQTRLRDSELVNQTLKEELEVVNALLAAVGEDSKIDASTASQAEDDPTNVLKAHLTEMRRLRKQLENQIQTHRNLGDNIEEQIRNRELTESPQMTAMSTTAGLRTDIYLRQSPIGRTNDDLQRHNSFDGSGENGAGDGGAPSAPKREQETALLRAELEAARAEAELSRAETEAARREQVRAEEDLSRAVTEAERKLRDVKEKLDRQLQQRQKSLMARLETVEADNSQLRTTMAEKDRELGETKKALKETKDLVNAVKTELSILSKMKKERRAKEKRSDLEFTTEYMKEMDKLREQLREAVKENQRLRHRLEEFQVPNTNGSNRPSTGTKTFLGQEVHVHHDCASVKGKTSATSTNGQNASLNGNGSSALPNGIRHPARDHSAPSSRPPASGGGSTETRRRSHSSSEGEDVTTERADGRCAQRRVNRSRELNRGSDSGLWSLTGALNVVAGNGNDADGIDRGLKGILTADRLQLTPGKKSHNSSKNSSGHSPKNDTSYLITDKEGEGIRVSGDLRYLFAVGRLDDLELLKKEVAESRVVIEGLHAITKDRLHHLNASSPDKNPEFGLLRKMEVGFSNLSTLLREVERLGAEFWTSTLPASGGDKDMSKDNAEKSFDKSQDKSGDRSQNGESEEVLILKCKLKTQERLLHQAISRLEATNKMKEGIEGEVIKRLTRHYKVLKDARNNLENFQLPAGAECETC